MDRKDFLRKGFLGTGIFAASVSGLKALANGIDELEPLTPQDPNQILGFNHIENTKSTIMAHTILHKANSRGDANHGWLHSKHTFSFANYYNPERMHFGALRVLNDDRVAGGMGFGTHPHDNMEIISIPLSGDLKHKDSMGNEGIIRNGDVQIMSAGTGVRHSEMNANADEEVRFLQIWVIPNQRNVQPRYDQLTLDAKDRKNKFQQIISPHQNDEGMSMHQNAWFHLTDMDANTNLTYEMKAKNNGLYVFNLSGDALINDLEVATRDGLGIWEADKITINARQATSLLLMEVPMIL